MHFWVCFGAGSCSCRPSVLTGSCLPFRVREHQLMHYPPEPIADPLVLLKLVLVASLWANLNSE